MEQYLGWSGEEILYVGDHIFADVRVSKNILRWRTALVLREIEEELGAVEAFRREEQSSWRDDVGEGEAGGLPQLASPRPAGGCRAAMVPSPPPPRRELQAAVNALRARLEDARQQGRRRWRKEASRGAQPRLGTAAAGGKRQEPSRASGGAIGRHLHLARVELPLRNPFAYLSSSRGTHAPRPLPLPRPVARLSSPTHRSGHQRYASRSTVPFSRNRTPSASRRAR